MAGAEFPSFDELVGDFASVEGRRVEEQEASRLRLEENAVRERRVSIELQKGREQMLAERDLVHAALVRQRVPYTASFPTSEYDWLPLWNFRRKGWVSDATYTHSIETKGETVSHAHNLVLLSNKKFYADGLLTPETYAPKNATNAIKAARQCLASLVVIHQLKI